MNPHRRQLLKLGALGTILSPTDALLAGLPRQTLQVAEITDGEALPRFSPGDWLLADTRSAHFEGDGLYLYPDWGQPRAYLVRRVEAAGQGAVLQFHNPGSGRLLWTQSLEGEALFAARICGHLPAAELPPLQQRCHFVPLQLPVVSDRS